MQRTRRLAGHPGRASGAVALEFALVSPVLFLIIFGIVGLYLLMMQDVSLESAVRRVTREIQYQQPASADNANVLAAKVRNGLESRLGTRLHAIECVRMPMEASDGAPSGSCTGAKPGDLLLFTVTIRPTVMFLSLPRDFTFRRVLAVRARA